MPSSNLCWHNDHSDWDSSWFSSVPSGECWGSSDRPLLSTFYPIHYSLISLPFDATESVLLTVLINKPQINK
jgi:hypothetical protein